MKRRIGLLLSLIVLALCLTSCNLTFTSPKAQIGTVWDENTLYEQLASDITQTTETVKKACVGVYVEHGQTASIGSGVIYKMIDKATGEKATEDATDVTCFVVTNEHVINAEGSKDVSYNVYLGDDEYVKADPVGSDMSNDLAVLTFNVNLKDYDLSYVDIDEDTNNLPTAGNFCIAIGCPLDLDNFNYVSVGNISKVTISEIMHTAAINPGNSGGALFSTNGKLLGINARKNTVIEEDGDIVPIEGMGTAIPVWTVKGVIEDIESTNGYVVRPTLGVTALTVNITLNPEDSAMLPNTVKYDKDDLEEETETSDDKYVDKYIDLKQGIVISAVTAGSNASKASSSDELAGDNPLLVGDVIYMVNGNVVTRSLDITYVLNTSLIGDKLKLVIFRQIDGSWYALNYIVNLGA